MRTINKVKSAAFHVANDKNVQHYGMMLARHGLTGAVKKIHPAAIMLDAGISVLEAYKSYARYAQAREVTKQIELENEVLREEIEQAVRSFGLELAALEQEAENRAAVLERAITEAQATSAQAVTSTRNMLEQTKKIHALVKKEREQGISFDQLLHLQSQLDAFIRGLVMHTVSCVEED